ncbi:MAG TPA: hypothetical protein DCQ98_17920 [Planctomycetaceae bacterium]|nr:hypothetical protein [Planctomycetaceae bacterium]
MARRTGLRIAELSETPLALLGREFCTRRIIDEAFGKARVTLQVRVEMNSVEGLVAVASSGGPPTILPRLAVRASGASVVKLERPTPKRTVCLLTTIGATESRARSEFSALLRRQVAVVGEHRVR